MDYKTRLQIDRYACRHCDRDDITYRHKERAKFLLRMNGFEETEAEEFEVICQDCAQAFIKKNRFQQFT
jgi:hypothetical protein